MKWILALAVLVAAVALSPAAAPAAPRECGQMAFTPNSDDMASQIRAEGVTCRTARKFVRAVEGNAPKRFRGYRCRRTERDTALPSWRYRCIDGAKRISWVKT